MKLRNNLSKSNPVVIWCIKESDLIVDNNNNPNGRWIHYKFADENGIEYYGYELVEDSKVVEVMPNILNSYYVSNHYKYVNKYIYNDIDNEYLKELIMDCHQSDNEMWYIDEEDMPDQETLDKLLEDVEKYELNGYIELTLDRKDDRTITVYGGISTQFLFKFK